MSTRDQRREWQEFREKHGETVQIFQRKWQAMFGRPPRADEINQYKSDRRRLLSPLGRQQRKGEPVIQLVTATLKYEWDMGHRLPDHKGKCRRLHGHRYVAHIDLTGPVQLKGPSAGMVVDFYDVKQAVEKVLGEWDHRTMLHEDDTIIWDATDPDVEREYGIFRVPVIPTVENMCLLAISALRVVEGVKVTRIRIYETPNCWAEVKVP